MVALYVAAMVGTISIVRLRRKTRWPFKEDDKLLRGPGERLRRRLVEIDERFMWEYLTGIVLPMVSISGVVSLGRFVGTSDAVTLAVAILSGIVVLGLCVWRMVRQWRERSNCLLGWFGERVVGEQLQLATVHGWRVFHDVPSPTGNVDHVAIGLGGVFVIETKTRRKGHARPGFDDHKVYFDGRDLVWPWGEDNHGLEQAEQNALWLTNWIRTEIGERVHASPILALPGWWLESKPARETRLCRVVNPKWLPGFLAKERPALTAKQVDLIALRLDARCRDVEE